MCVFVRASYWLSECERSELQEVYGGSEERREQTRRTERTEEQGDCVAC
jgi:hypothetical protein